MFSSPPGCPGGCAPSYHTLSCRINKASGPAAAARGHRVLMSNFDAWYLDHLGIPWQAMYANDILEGVREPEHEQLYLGGEVCVWGETVDPSDLQQTIWPRTAAAAGTCARFALQSNMPTFHGVCTCPCLWLQWPF